MQTIEKTLRYYPLLMTINLDYIKDYNLPEGYHFECFKDGDIESWVNIHMNSGEFTSIKRGKEIFYGHFIGELGDRCIFIVNENNEKVGTATVSPSSEFGYNCVIDWLAIKKDYQGKKLAKPLISKILNVAKGLNYDKVMLHTQTHTWLAAKLYLDFGFEPFIDRDVTGWEILNTIINHQKLDSFKTLNEKEIYHEISLNIVKMLDSKHKDYNYEIWFKDNRNDVWVNEDNILYKYKFYNEGKNLDLVWDGKEDEMD